MNILFKRSLWSLLVVVLAWNVGSASDRVNLQEVGAASASPDGRWLVWDQRETDHAGTPTRTRVWVLDLEHPEQARPLFPDDDYNVRQPRFSEDGQWIYFLSDVSGVEQLWRTPTGETAAEQVR